MKTARERAEKWLESRHEADDSFSWDLSDLKSLEILLKEQDKITRHACAEACLGHGDAPAIEMIGRCHSACMNVKAVWHDLYRLPILWTSCGLQCSAWYMVQALQKWNIKITNNTS